MKRHLKRFAWLYLTLIAAIAYPAFIVYMQRVPKYDVPTLYRLDRLIQEGFARSHPNVAIRQHTESDKFNLSHLPEERAFILSSLVSEEVGYAAMPAVKPELDRITKICAWEYDKIEKINFLNIAYFPINATDSTPTRESSESPDYPNYLAIQYLTNIRKSQAEAAIYEHRWDDALRLLESTAQISNSSRYSDLTGSLVAIAMRHFRAYPGYNDLLCADPPPKVAEAALQALVRLRETDPTIDEWTSAAEIGHAIREVMQNNGTSSRDIIQWYLSEGNGGFLNESNFWMFAEAKGLVSLRQHIKDPALKRWADQFDQKNPPPENICGTSSAIADMMKWTTVPSVRKWLNQMARKEPWTYRWEFIPEDEYAIVDHRTLMMLGVSSMAREDDSEAQTKAEISRIQGRLVEAGFASSLYKSKHGVFPTELKQLAEFYPLPANKLPTSNSKSFKAAGAYLPIRFSERAMTPEMAGTLWRRVLGLHGWSKYMKSGFHSDGSFILAAKYSKSDYFAYIRDKTIVEPVRMLAIEEYLKMHPRLVESVQVEATTISIPTKELVAEGIPEMPPEMETMPGMPPGMMPEMQAASAKTKKPAPPAVFKPLDAVLARQITEDSYRLKAYRAAKTARNQKASVSSESTYDPSIAIPPTADVTTITQPNFIRIDEIRLTGKLRAPDKAMVIWSPGPDGKDDNAQIVYDATNGTVSGGDIVLFPENY